jgi:hemoglobin
MTEPSADRDDSDDATDGSGTLYERLGGREAIASVVEDFYDRMLDDDRVAGFFEDVDMARQRAHQTQFLSSVTGGPVEYDGREMREAHEGMGITDEDYDIVGGHLDASLADAGVADTDREAVMQEVEALRDPIVGW